VHPYQTARELSEAITTLASFVRKPEWETVGKALSPELHELVTGWYTLPSEKKADLMGYCFGKLGTDLITPAAFSKAGKGMSAIAKAAKKINKAKGLILIESAASSGNIGKYAMAFKASEYTAFVGEELGLSMKKMSRLKKAGRLDKVLNKHLKHLSLPEKQSFDFINKVQARLKPYAKKAFPEKTVRKYIHESGISTFTRPEGIPKNYLVRITEKGAGMEYFHPTNTHLKVRVMPGKPHSPFPYQKRPYVVQMKNGKAFDKYGNLILHERPQAHIRIEDFIYRE
jgi:hypothetical protein